MDLLDELQAHPLFGDGALGTLLLDSGIPLAQGFEELCVTDPDKIEQIHQQYIDSGARLIETNSFGGNAVCLERFGLEGGVVEINRAAAQVATKAARGTNVYVAGFREQVTALLEGGTQLIFFETSIDFEEMEVALRARLEVSTGLTICSFSCGADGRLASGTLLIEAFAKLRDFGAEIVGVNCVNGERESEELLKQVPVEYGLCAYPNAGSPKYRQGRFIYGAAPEDFAKAAREMVDAGARLIGGCCGSSPKHIAAIASALTDLQAG